MKKRSPSRTCESRPLPPPRRGEPSEAGATAIVAKVLGDAAYAAQASVGAGTSRLAASA